MKKIILTLSVFLLPAGVHKAQGLPQSNGIKPGFTENKGQISDQYFQSRSDILFAGSISDLDFYIKNDGISYQLNRVDKWEKKPRFKKPLLQLEEDLVPTSTTCYRLDIKWLGAATSGKIVKGPSFAGYANYYLESCPEGALNVNTYSSLLYKDVYPGIDLKWYEKDGNLKYDYYVAAHTDYKKIQLEYKGAESIHLENGELIITTPLGVLKEQKPLVLQNNKVLNATWVIKGNVVTFDIKDPDPSLPIIIDPMIRLWGTYYGGTKAEDAYYTYADPGGNVFLSGGALSSSNIATTGAHQTVFGAGFSGNNDAYIVKFNSSGVRLWATYYGGTGDEYAGEAITDAGGNVYLAGATTTSNSAVITTPGAHQVIYSTLPTNTGDGFLVKFNAGGVRQWGTYYGGDKQDFTLGISLDNANNIYVTGGSHSANNISTPGSHQVNLAGTIDAYLAKFNSSGVRQWGTYYGGVNSQLINEAAFDCVTDLAGDTYISGVTSSTSGISTSGSHQTVFGGGTSVSDAFFAKFNSSGVVQWGTYYGGNANDVGSGLAFDGSGNLYCSGFTSGNLGTSTVIASTGSHQLTLNGGYDAFLVKFDPSGSRLWGTYYGGQGDEYGFTTTVDPAGNVYLSGNTTSSGSGSAGMVSTACAYQPLYGGGSTDAFLVKFTSGGSRIWGTFYGSIYTDNGMCCSSDASGNIYLCGTTLANSGTVMASSNGHQPIGPGAGDAYLAKFDGCIPGAPVNTMTQAAMTVCSGNSATLSTTCGNWYNSPTGGTPLGTGSTFTIGPLTSDTTLYVEDFGCGSVFGTRTVVHLTVVARPELTVTASNAAPCVGEQVTVTVSGASTYSWVSPTTTLSSFQIYLLNPTTFSVTGTDANGCKATATVAVNPDFCLVINESGIPRGVAVYPNPSSGRVSFEAFSDTDLLLTNELGQEIERIYLSASNGYRGSVDNLIPGIYFLKGENENSVVIKKIIVMK